MLDAALGARSGNSAPIEEVIDGRYVLDSLLSVRFDNPSNFCFANAACSALMWSTACLSNFSWTQWGIGYDTFCEIMVRGLQHPLCLDGFFNIVAKYNSRALAPI